MSTISLHFQKKDYRVKCNAMELARLIRELSGLTAADMARKLGKTRQNYWKFENHALSLTLNELEVLRSLFKGSDSEFLKLVKKCDKKKDK